MKINTHKTANAKAKIQGVKLPLAPIIVPTKSPMAPWATKIPGAVALRGIKFKLIEPPPTWNKAFPIPTKMIADIGNS